MKSLIKACLVCAAFAASSAAAFAGAYKVYSPAWAWNNNFNGSAYTFNFGTGGNPQWNATFNLPTSGGLKGYPASIRGTHYSLNPTTDTLFPRRIATTSSIPLSFKYNTSGAVSGDWAYDCFLRWDTTATTPQVEVMIWGNNNSYPIGTRVAQNVITRNGVTYDLWYGYNSGAGYWVYTFIPVRSSVPAHVLTGTGTMNIDLMDFFDVLDGRSNYNIWLYLDVVEAGFEIIGGNGTISCYWFTCDAY